MRILIFIVLSLIPNLLLSQILDFPFDRSVITVNDQTKKIEFIYIDSIPDSNKDKLYSNALEWIALNFKDATSVIKLQDKDAGKIIAKGMTRLSYSYKWLGNDMVDEYNQFFTIDISLRNNRYKIVFTDFIARIDATGSGYTYTPAFEVTAERYLEMTPETYNFQSMSRGEKQGLVTRKQILQNTFYSSNNFSLSLKKGLGKSDNW